MKYEQKNINVWRQLRTHDKEFKLNSIRLFLERGGSYKEISEEMGIPPAILATWVDSAHSH